jgi:hypothetical protein
MAGMSWRARLGCGAAAVLVLVAPAPAAAMARRAPISGTLSRPGYTVLALAANGKATSVRASHRSFSLRPPAASVTLQLRAPNGIYAGPVLIGSAQKGRRAIVGVRAGARLGRITIDARHGYAKVARRVSNRWVDSSRWARARRGVPIGAGDFGRVRSTPPRVPPPGDLDADGVPDVLDVDINGNLILNHVDRSTSRRARAAQTGSSFFIGANLVLPLWDAMNANAGAVTDAQIDAALSKYEWLGIGILPGCPELDCGGTPDPNNPQGWIGGLSYCTRGGTGEALVAGTSPAAFQPFPACCDPDGDGLGTLANNSPNPPPGALFLYPHATAGQIGTGDVLIQRVTSNGVTSDTPTMLPYIFATGPTLVSYHDGQGSSATVNYPVPTYGPGTPGHAFPAAAGPNGDVALTLTFWRPQRRSMPSEQGSWIDIGKLSYGAGVQSVGGITQGGLCPQGAFTEDDPNLSPPQTFNSATDRGGVTDQAPDQPANPVNTITYTLDLTRCLAAHGVAWNPGQEALVHFSAVDGFGASVTETDTWAVFERR